MIRQTGTGLNRGLRTYERGDSREWSSVLVDVVFSTWVGILENGLAVLVYAVGPACGTFWRDYCWDGVDRLGE
jgi:hypothetical protein